MMNVKPAGVIRDLYFMDTAEVDCLNNDPGNGTVTFFLILRKQ
jgi:hypothetical protein